MTAADDELDLGAVELELETSLWRDSVRDYAYGSPAYELITGVPLRSNYAVDAMLDVYQAFADGHVKRARIEIGPGLSKSSLRTVVDTWRLARKPAHRAIHGSHAFDLAARDSRRARRIVESAWYRARFGLRLHDDENTIARWTTTAGGSFAAVGVGGGITGHRTDEIVIDDPLNAVAAHSKAKRDEVYAWFAEGLVSRLDGDGEMCVIGQRLGADDLHGRLSDAGGWTVLTLPAEFDARRRCFVFGLDGHEIWRDPRTQDGQLLAPDVLGAAKLAELKTSIGSAAFQSQYNQAPSSDETSICPATWWRFYRPDHTATGQRRPVGCSDAPAIAGPDRLDRVVIGCDLTFGSTSETADYAVVAVWGAKGGARFCLDLWRRRAGFDDQLGAIGAMAKKYPGAKIIVEAAANGRAVIETLRKELPGVIAVKPQGSKAARISAVTPQIESGACYLPEGAAWVVDLVEEFQAFPGRHDDIPDACAYCLTDLATTIDYNLPCVGPMSILTIRDSSSESSFSSSGSFGRRSYPTMPEHWDPNDRGGW